MRALSLLLLAACDGGFADPARATGPEVPADAPLQPERVVRPKTHGVVDTPRADVDGTPIGVACATCHGPTPDTSWLGGPSDGDPERTFHTGVQLVHGSNVCASCHSDDRTKLHLADGTQLDLADSIQLCGQCHGSQYADFQHGAHGGMNGYWDLRRGPRTRNHCASCHAPHTPAYEPMRPVLPPIDRAPPDDAPHEAPEGGR